MTKLGEDAFQYYVSLGKERSYEAVAVKFKASKRAVSKRATKERWQFRLNEIEREANSRAEKRLLDTLEEMNTRHLTMLKFVQTKALEAMRTMPFRSGLEAAKALDFALRQERTIRGEPNERSVLTVEETIKSEYDRWMVVEGKGTVVDVPEIAPKS